LHSIFLPKKKLNNLYEYLGFNKKVNLFLMTNDGGDVLGRFLFLILLAK